MTAEFAGFSPTYHDARMRDSGGQVLNITSRNYGAECDGYTDDTAAWLKAFDELDRGNAGGKIMQPAGTTSLVSDTLYGGNAITLGSFRRGQSATITPGGNRGGRLIQTANKTLLNLDTCQGWALENIELSYASLSYGDIPLVSMRGPNCGFGRVTDVSFTSSAPASNQSCDHLIDLGGSEDISFENSLLMGAKFLVYGVSPTALTDYSYSNGINWRKCTFRQYSNYGCVNPDKAWTFDTCSFEPATNGAGQMFNCESGHQAQGLTLLNDWAGDNTSGAWINFRGSGLAVIGGSWNLGNATSALVKFLEAVNGVFIGAVALRGAAGSSTVDVNTFTTSTDVCVLSTPEIGQTFKGSVFPVSGFWQQAGRAIVQGMFQIGTIWFRDNAGAFEKSTDNGATWVAV